MLKQWIKFAKYTFIVKWKQIKFIRNENRLNIYFCVLNIYNFAEIFCNEKTAVSNDNKKPKIKWQCFMFMWCWCSGMDGKNREGICVIEAIDGW